MSSSVALETEKKEEDVKGGELLFCGTTYWGTADRRHVSPQSNLISPTRLRPLVGVDIRFVASGSASSHCVALDVDGRCYTWGRNDKGQLGHVDTIIREKPTLVSGLSKYKVVKAGSGVGHTVVLTEDGLSFSFGWNKHGQLGTGSTKNEFELSPVRCLITDVKDVSCGADFTVWLSSIEGASILTAGHPQYGQLGHGTDNEYNMKESSVKLAYEAQPVPKAIASLSKETIIKLLVALIIQLHWIQRAMFIRGAMEDMEGLDIESKKTNLPHVVLMFSQSIILYHPLRLFQLVL